MKLIHGDCLEVLKTLKENSIDSLVTDPPAGISFMNKEWDHHKGGRDEWIQWMSEIMLECLRVMKPGAHGLVWAIPRTNHWTGTALELAGFEVRDVITHLFGQGFPKSLNISKAIDKAAGVERERIKGTTGSNSTESRGKYNLGEAISDEAISDGAIQWNGWGTALKPAVEFWYLVRKPCSEKTVAENVLKWGTGGINIDGSRIAGQVSSTIQGKSSRQGEVYGVYQRELRAFIPNTQGRFPSNLVLSHSPYCTDDQCDIECAIKRLDEQSGNCKSAGQYKEKKLNTFEPEKAIFKLGYQTNKYSGESGGASRFFYCAKISTSERGEGNTHPTVKPKKLMKYLINLINPPNGLVLDPFMGSGSTGLACKETGFQFIGIEKELEYFEIAKKRVGI